MEQKSENTNIQKNRLCKKMIRVACFLCFFIIFAAFNVSGNESSCVRCHTDEKMLKPLVVVPKISEEAGGG
ncbi:MAG: hypothetical protein NT010_00055 [Proteobacteria bacterium]|nr:hypothetical protein [Pseudomonadota bacterium]